VINWPASYRTDDKIDFQIQAIIANRQQTWNYDHMFILPADTAFAYCSSGWSQTQTFTIPDTSKPVFTSQVNSSTEKICQVGAVFGFDSAKIIIVTVGVIIIVLLVALIISTKRRAGTLKPEVLG
jgi:hypothetical protein